MKKLALILTLCAIGITSMAHSQGLPKGQWIDLTTCMELGNDNPVCQVNLTPVRQTKHIMNILREAIIPIISKVEVGEETVAETQQEIEPVIIPTESKPSSILVPDVHYTGTNSDGHATYCYPLDTDVIGIYTWECN